MFVIQIAHFRKNFFGKRFVLYLSEYLIYFLIRAKPRIEVMKTLLTGKPSLRNEINVVAFRRSMDLEAVAKMLGTGSMTAYSKTAFRAGPTL